MDIAVAYSVQGTRLVGLEVESRSTISANRTLTVAVEAEPSQIIGEFALIWCKVYLNPSDMVLNCVRVGYLLTNLNHDLDHLISLHGIWCINAWNMFLILPIRRLDSISDFLSHNNHTDPRHCD